MGYLMKEALKALCGVNQWSYAVFWKIGCQNPKLLIWEECYYEAYTSSTTNTGHTMENQGMHSQKLDGYQNVAQVENRVHILMDKMMMSNQVNLVGEGLVGRAAFTGNHQWIVSGNHNEFSYPAEVLHEVNLQFSAGIKTIAVIPVIPQGVVQFGSPLEISENVGFVHDVRSLIIQLGCVPNAFTSDNYIPKDDCMSGLPASNATTNPLVAGSFNLQRNSSNSFLTQFQDNLQVSGSSFTVNNLSQDIQRDNTSPSNGLAGDRIIGGPLMPSKRDSAMNQLTNNRASRISFPPSSASCSRPGNQDNVNGSNTVISTMNSDLQAGINGQQSQSFQTTHANKMFQDTGYSMENLVAVSKTVDQSSNSSMLTSAPFYGNYNNDSVHTANCIPNQVQESDLQDVLKTLSKSQEHLTSSSFLSDDFHDGSHMISSNNFNSDDSFFQSAEGDDLFDVLGMDMKNKLLKCNESKVPNAFDASSGSQIKDLTRSMKFQNFASGIYRDFEGVSESGVFSTGSDHLLDAVISGVSSSSRQTSDDNMSCRTTSVPSTPSVNLFTREDSMQRPLFGFSKSIGGPLGRSIRSMCGKTEGGIRSTTSSWIEQGPATSVSTANSKKGDEGGKTNRKRLQPGESPRPRPKDRQMIQDRVKELREIVPNGAKCSIDSLLERTIKHMIFLQSVSHHSDKLKLMDSKDRKEAGMLLRDNFEGGATWAFELGSQSMVCPIVVEDLNPPRQLLVEMLCEERGFFLEIADIIRGLGLTILKGVMESRNDKIWGRFAVEADRDVTRMEVFISLVHLLEQTLNSHSANDDPVMYPATMANNQEFAGQIVCSEPSTM